MHDDASLWYQNPSSLPFLQQWVCLHMLPTYSRRICLASCCLILCCCCPTYTFIVGSLGKREEYEYYEIFSFLSFFLSWPDYLWVLIDKGSSLSLLCHDSASMYVHVLYVVESWRPMDILEEQEMQSASPPQQIADILMAVTFRIFEERKRRME